MSSGPAPTWALVFETLPFMFPDNGAPFTPWLIHTTAVQATFTSTANHTYSFFSVARDLTGNSEAIKSTAEASTQVVPIAQIGGRVTGAGGNAAGQVTMA